jgi:ACR3 family arsenite efflux pump ArsB
MKWLLDPLKWLFAKLLDPKTPTGKVVIILVFLMFCIAAGLVYVYITDEEPIKIEKAEGKNLK